MQHSDPDMGLLCSSTAHDDPLPHPSSVLSSPPPPPLDPFPLLDLPQEVILAIVHHADERNPSPTFPSGPSDTLLALSQINRWFRSVCDPLVWRSVSYRPTSHLRPATWRAKRDLRALRDLVVARQQGGQGGGGGVRPTLPIMQLSVDELTSLEAQEDNEAQEEEDAWVELVEALATGEGATLQVLFLKDIEMSAESGRRLLHAMAAPTSRLSALRFNQVEFFPNHPDVVRTMEPLNRIKTLQIMHSDPELFDLTDLCPSIDSLLLWPQSRRMRRRLPAILRLLPHLRNLSLDAVHECDVFRDVADEVLRLSSLPTAAPLPLEELFLEGPSRQEDLRVLLQAFAHLPHLKRLALYQVQEPSPALFDELARAAPQLQALTVVAGDCQEPCEWPEPLEAYLPALSRFPSLRFLATDRLTEPREETPGNGVWLLQKRLEFEGMALLARACKSLREAVALTRDVSDGSAGYFATFTREKGRTRITLKHKTVNDFLIAYDRWVRVEDD
ncbi:hypothetical protein JCM6882_000525 [Rhodosporidiobolus microsporus]